MSPTNLGSHQQEIARGDRFEFGANWAAFLGHLNDSRIALAEASLREMLGVRTLNGKRFLDAGSGSGLFSLAARRLGARVHSFDYDPQSVACTRELRNRYFPDDDQWSIDEASVLDDAYMDSLGVFDVVYSWGVLHHTGAMWTALENAASRANSGGALFVAIYNDQGGASTRWRHVKRIYNWLPRPAKPLFAAAVMLPREVRFASIALVRGKMASHLAELRNYSTVSGRGMSRWHDMIDWVGGYPFEVAKPEQIFDFFHDRGFQLQKLRTCGGALGCNEFVFRAPSAND